MATFYCPRGKENTDSLYKQLHRLLAQGDEYASPDFCQSSDEDTFLRRFDPPAAHDTTIIQLALNRGGDTTSAWHNMRERLENLLGTPNQRPAWWGYTLTYQAALPPDVVNLDHALNELRPSVRRLTARFTVFDPPDGIRHARRSPEHLWR